MGCGRNDQTKNPASSIAGSTIQIWKCWKIASRSGMKQRRALSSPRVWRPSRPPYGLMFGLEPSSCTPIRFTAGRISCSKRYCRNLALPRSGFPQRVGVKALAAAAEKAQSIGPVTVLYIETPADPTNGLVDLAAAREVADKLRDLRPTIIVDNTMLGPLYQTPLAHGSDLVITSLTKYVGGHSDLIAGSCSGSRAKIELVHGMRTILGTMCDPQTTWMLMRSLETMKLRMDAAIGNARKVAEFLRGHKHVKSVWYLAFLPEKHPDRTIFERQCKSAGSTFSFEVRGDETEAFTVLDHLEVIKLAVSLGGTESLASHPASVTHSDISAGEKARLGITPSLIRLSVGIENSDDLIADLDQALAAIS